MEVISYQLFIVVTIVATHFLKRSWVIWACALWTLETLALLAYTPLITVQLIVIWGTWFLLDKNQSQKERLNELEGYLSESPQDIKELALSVEEPKKEILQGQNHKDFLIKSIQQVEQSIVILSGWITNYVVNQYFIQELESALKRGVKIFIGYGWQNSMGKHEEFESSIQAINQIEILVLKYPDQLFVGKFANHEKILIKDDDYVVYGSNNWLSNSKFKNSERSIVINSPELANKEYRRAVDLINSNLIVMA